MDSREFFNQVELEGYVDRLQRVVERESQSPSYTDSYLAIADGLAEIAVDPSQWSQKCLYCIEAYGAGLKRFLNRIESESHESIMNNCAVIYFFFREYRYWSKGDSFDTTGVAFAFQKLENIIDLYLDVDSDFQRRFRKAESKIDSEILRFRVNNESFLKLLSSSVSQAAIDKRISELTDLLGNKTELIEALDNKISKLRTEYNFIGLYKGFQDVSKKKEVSRKGALKFTYMLGGALISVPFLVIILGLVMQYMGLLDLTLLQFLAIPVISAEVFLFYYFRLKYLEVKSFDAQLLQLDVRMSLCQFVEAYSKFATEIHKESPGLLSSFEALVFSPIVAKESDIPPLIDGANQITDLISKIRK